MTSSVPSGASEPFVSNRSARAHIAVVGTGEYAARDRAALRLRDEDTELVIVGDDPRDLASTLFEKQVDLLVLCTRVDLRAAAVRLAAPAATPMLCAPPFATSCEEARELYTLAGNAPLAIGQPLRFCSDLVRAHTLIALGVIGDVLLAAGEMGVESPISLLQSGVEAIGFARALFGPLESVSSTGKRVLARNTTGSFAKVEFVETDVLENSFTAQVIGTRGRIELNERGSRYRLTGDTTWRRFGDGVDIADALLRQIDAMLDLDARALGTMRRDAIETMRTIDALYASRLSERWERITERPPARIPSSSGPR